MWSSNSQNVRSWPELKPRVGCLTEWASQAPLKTENTLIGRQRWQVHSYGGAAFGKAKRLTLGEWQGWTSGVYMELKPGVVEGVEMSPSLGWGWALECSECPNPACRLYMLGVGETLEVSAVCLFSAGEWDNYLYVFSNTVLYLYAFKYKSNNRDISRITAPPKCARHHSKHDVCMNSLHYLHFPTGQGLLSLFSFYRKVNWSTEAEQIVQNHRASKRQSED